MKISKLFFSLFITAIIFSCSKDSSTSTPQNPSNPSNPTNPCAGITCLNGGTCINGLCACPEGYTGPNCSTQITPKKIRVSKVEVIRFPATENNGGGWDIGSGPDIYPIVRKGNVEIWNSPNYYTDASSFSSYPFIPSPSFDLDAPNDQYTISLYDFDTADPDDFMGGINFFPYSSNNKFPSVLTLDAGGTVAFKIYLSYIW